MMTAFDLTGAVALVTGGNRGIGRGIALGLAEAGASIAIAARDQRATADVVAEVEAAGGRAVGLAVDVTRRADLDAAVATTIEAFGGLTVLVNNAGIASGASAPEVTDEAAWDAVLDTNLKAAFLACQAVFPALAARGGAIINVSSGMALTASELNPPYGASKAAVVHLTRTLAAAWGRRGIRVNAILPGFVRTEIVASLADPTFQARVAAQTPLGRLAEPGEFGAIATFLASPAAAFVTGAALLVDGGITIRTTTAMRGTEP